MRHLNKLMVILSFSIMTFVTAQDAAGDYKLNAVYVKYTDLAREAANLTVYDIYGLDQSFDLLSFDVMDPIGQVINGPVGGPYLAQTGVNLNVSLYDDGTGAFTEGSTYPTTDLVDCVTELGIFPVTDEIIYSSDMANVGENVAQLTSILGMESGSPYVQNFAWVCSNGEAADGCSNYGNPCGTGTACLDCMDFCVGYVMANYDYTEEQANGFCSSTPDADFGCADSCLDFVEPGVCLPTGDQLPIGTFALYESELFDYFPEEPTLIDLDGDGTPDLPGFAQGYITDQTVPWVDMFNSTTGELVPDGVPDLPAADIYMEWHAIDGIVSQSGFGDILFPEEGWDEDGDGTPLDRILGLGAIPSSNINAACVPAAANDGFQALNYPAFGDLSAAYPDGCIEVVSVDMGYILNPALSSLGGLAGPMVTWHTLMVMAGNMDIDQDGTPDSTLPCLAADEDGTCTLDDTMMDFDPSCLADGDLSDCMGRLVFNHPAQCFKVLEERQVYIDFYEVSSSLAGDVNLDGNVDVVDVVAVVGHILGNTTLEGESLTNADISGDGTIDVVDVVAIVSEILNGRSADNATSATIKTSDNSVLMDSNGFVGAIQMTLSHTDNFKIEMTSNAMVADYKTSGNKTTLIVVAPEGELFTASGDYTIDEVLAATNDGYINVSVETPFEFEVSAAYPNPFNPSTNLKLDLNTDSNVNISVYNVMGQLTDVLVNDNLSANSYSLTWNASDVPSGLYFIKTKVGTATSVQKVMLIK